VRSAHCGQRWPVPKRMSIVYVAGTGVRDNCKLMRVPWTVAAPPRAHQHTTVRLRCPDAAPGQH